MSSSVNPPCFTLLMTQTILSFLVVYIIGILLKYYFFIHFIYFGKAKSQFEAA